MRSPLPQRHDDTKKVGTMGHGTCLFSRRGSSGLSSDFEVVIVSSCRCGEWVNLKAGRNANKIRITRPPSA